MIHELKTWPEYFRATYFRLKNFEIRKEDRDFKVGDILDLKEYDPIERRYSGRTLRAEVVYLEGSGFPGLEKGYCVMGIIVLEGWVGEKWEVKNE